MKEHHKSKRTHSRGTERGEKKETLMPIIEKKDMTRQEVERKITRDKRWGKKAAERVAGPEEKTKIKTT